ncbi:MAG: hypothetical protein ACPG5P_06440 [Saprospiraceae bacterium]
MIYFRRCRYKVAIMEIDEDGGPDRFLAAFARDTNVIRHPRIEEALFITSGTNMPSEGNGFVIRREDVDFTRNDQNIPNSDFEQFAFYFTYYYIYV